MTKTNDVKKVEALKLRESGMEKLEIVKKTGLSRATLTKLFKKAGLTNSKLSLSHIKKEPTENNDHSNDEKLNPSIKSEVGELEIKPEDIKGGMEGEPDTDIFKGTNVTFDSKKGNITLESSGGNEGERIKADGERDTDSLVPLAVSPVAGSFHQPRQDPPKQDLSLDRPEDPLDNFFSRGMIETLIPIGLIVSGYLIKGDKKETVNRGDAW